MKAAQRESEDRVTWQIILSTWIILKEQFYSLPFSQKVILYTYRFLFPKVGTSTEVFVVPMRGKLVCKLCWQTHLQLMLLTIFQSCVYSLYQCCLVLHFKRNLPWSLLPFEIKNQTTLVYTSHILYIITVVDKNCRFAFYKFFLLTWSDDIDVVFFKVKD